LLDTDSKLEVLGIGKPATLNAPAKGLVFMQRGPFQFFALWLLAPLAWRHWRGEWMDYSESPFMFGKPFAAHPSFAVHSDGRTKANFNSSAFARCASVRPSMR
jgi:hypothetical protein